MSFWVLPNTFLMHKKLRLLKKRFFWQILFFFSKSDDRAFPACTMGVARPQKYKKRSLLQAWRGRKGNPPPGEAGHVDGGRWISLNSKRQLWVSRILDFLQWRWVGEAKYGGCPRGMTFWQGPKTLSLAFYYTAWCLTRDEMYTEISARLSVCEGWQENRNSAWNPRFPINCPRIISLPSQGALNLVERRSWVRFIGR